MFYTNRPKNGREEEYYDEDCGEMTRKEVYDTMVFLEDSIDRGGTTNEIVEKQRSKIVKLWNKIFSF